MSNFVGSCVRWATVQNAGTRLKKKEMSQFAEPADKTPQLCTQASSTSTSIIFTTSTTTTLLSSLDYRDEFSTSAVGMYQ